MTQRSLWGEQEQPNQALPPKQPKQNSPLRAMILLLLGIVPALIAYSLDLQIGVWPNMPPELNAIGAYNQLALSILVGALCEMFIVFTMILPPASGSRQARLARVILFVLFAGVILASALFLAMSYLAPYSGVGERLVLPLLIFVISVILAVFSPLMPIWRFNVPDNEVWMLLSSSGHLVAYIGPGVHILRPLDDCKPYPESGVIAIKIDDSFTAQDTYPFRVRVNVVCLFNPLHADRSMWITLRNLSRSTLESSIKTDIEFIIRRVVGNYTREQFQARETVEQAMKTIAMDIGESMAGRAAMGIRLLASNGINVMIEETQMVAESRQRRASLEAMMPEGTWLPEALSVSIDKEGRIEFQLRPSSEFETLVNGVNKVLGSVKQGGRSYISVSAPRQQIPAATPPPTTQSERGEASSPTSLPPDKPQSEVRPAPDAAAKEDVIDTEMDEEQGLYIPRNPILPDD